MRVEAASAVPLLASGVKLTVGALAGPRPAPHDVDVPGHPGHVPAHQDRDQADQVGRRWVRAGAGNIRIAGNHVHHQVFGILIIIGTGIVLVSKAPRGAGLDVAAAVFGAGIGLTVDEFALWLHLEDVYWSHEGRKSVDAIFCVLVITGTLIGGAEFVTGRIGTAAWWSSVGVIALNLLLCLICMLKGKVVTGVIGIFISIVALIGAVRLAKPESWWAGRRYASRPRLALRAARRYDQHYEARWNRIRDLIAGAPSRERPG